MKKAFRLLISIVICLAILIVPMTVMAEEGIDYNINYEVNLTEGTNTYPIDGTVPYTVYILYPTAVGDYTITTNDGVLGIVSYHDMWVQFEPTEEIVNSNTVEWPCTDVNQSIMVAIKVENASQASITVTRKDLDTSNEIPWTIYENIASPEKFEMPSFVNVETFEDGYVDFEDSVVDDAVLGDDGYYHLNDKNGPVLFANLNDSIMSLYAMSGYGRVYAINYDDEGAVTKKIDFTDAFFEYIGALPTDENGAITSYYYPLTADLIEIFKQVGTTHNWYSGDNPWVYASEDAWMFAMYFDIDVTSMNHSENNTNNGNTNNDNDTNDTNDSTQDNTNDATQDNDSNVDTSDKAPVTGNNSFAVIVVMLAIVAVTFVAKKQVNN